MNDPYESETKRRWGQTEAFKIAAERTKSYTAEDWGRIKAEAKEIYQGFQQSKELPVNSKDVQKWVDAWQQHLHTTYYPCSNEQLLSLADLYEQDPRYATNIDKVGGIGTSDRMIEAIRHWKAPIL